MLESVKRAFDKGAFDENENKCPVDLETINNYLRIYDQNIVCFISIKLIFFLFIF